ncbi:2118_t:CDS:1 [Ambispora leptoticha]|uniref:2118_t:CDS:1 n=1 Tax=Ambispora leptoticha TaxID=144679 RepID=A0A9N9G797_9GLOM|nr:2118_t:CDS:1 [Ambispora leptoticha]
MSKQISLIYFLVTLTIFAFVFSPSANATPLKREPPTCNQTIDYCTFEPQKGNQSQQVLGMVTFTQFTNCTVRVTGQFNTVHGPSYDYDFHVIPSVAMKDQPIYDFDACLKDQIDQPFQCDLPPGTVPFNSLVGNLCAVMFENGQVDDVINGTAPVKQV